MTTYEVFVRLKAGDDLVHRGRVGADTDELASLYAARTYDEEDWAEMRVVRTEHLLPVPRHDLRADGGRSA